ncbi:hypothetical protein [Streptomyces sp. NPDC059649]|uniref:hypothetical protein n=1 Tax=Streptomyces sp. NPDC059649 TaxID=3346895 RepID=UPI0036CCFC04
MRTGLVQRWMVTKLCPHGVQQCADLLLDVAAQTVVAGDVHWHRGVRAAIEKPSTDAEHGRDGFQLLRKRVLRS